jgi:UDP-N-acetylglucosamine:LPS N-acetylglucosamine transferase
MYTSDLSFLHYAPLGVEGIRTRTAIMTDCFMEMYPMLLIVDVSVEVTMLARLCGIPTIVMLQHGRRTDRAHRNAYESAELLIAPFAESLASAESREQFSHKTLYSGGFSRYTTVDPEGRAVEQRNNIAVLLGKGGTSVDAAFIRFLAEHAKEYSFHVIGFGEQELGGKNIIWHGHQDNPLELLCACSVVIGNAGHNTVMEMADLNKRFICIPEERPFEEQEKKAAMLALNGNAIVVRPADLYTQDWPGILKELTAAAASWEGVIDKKALQKIAEAIKSTADTIYGTVQ